VSEILLIQLVTCAIETAIISWRPWCCIKAYIFHAGSAELPSESVTLPVSPSISRKGSTSDSENDHQPLIKLVRAPRIHRRRRTDSGGSTGSEASVIRPEGGARPESEAALTRTGSERSLRHALHRRSIEQAVMNSSTSLRRTGSERALKRTGSEKALRRTGSGDIPAGKGSIQLLQDCMEFIVYVHVI